LIVLALVCFNELLSLVSANDDLQDQVVLSHHSIGQIYDTEGALFRALKSYMMALDIWMFWVKTNRNVDRHVIAQLLNNIAEVHDKKKRYAFAL